MSRAPLPPRQQPIWRGLGSEPPPPPPTSLSEGELGDCWFVSALAAIASHDGGKLLKRVLLTPEVDPTGAGVYAVRFWKNGHCERRGAGHAT